MIEIVYKDKNNLISVIFYKNGVAIPWTGVTRIVVSFDGSDVIVDEASGSSVIDWSGDAGEIKFDFKAIAVPVRAKLYATVQVYDPLHPLGQVLVDAEDKALQFIFRKPVSP